jgi:hypothetical protein
MAKENKKLSQNPKRESKTIAEKVQLRLSQLDKKSSNISKQINSLQKKLDESNKLKTRIEILKGNLAKVKRAKELELAEISLMCSTYAKLKHTEPEISKVPELHVVET